MLDTCVCLFVGETFSQGKTFENTRAGFSNKQQGDPRLTNKDPEQGVPPDRRGTLGEPSQEQGPEVLQGLQVLQAPLLLVQDRWLP